jgi:hypothetical protein
MCKENENVADAPPSGINLPGSKEDTILALIQQYGLLFNSQAIFSQSEQTVRANKIQTIRHYLFQVAGDLSQDPRPPDFG